MPCSTVSVPGLVLVRGGWFEQDSRTKQLCVGLLEVGLWWLSIFSTLAASRELLGPVKVRRTSAPAAPAHGSSPARTGTSAVLALTPQVLSHLSLQGIVITEVTIQGEGLEDRAGPLL